MQQTKISKALLFTVIEVHLSILNKHKPGVTSEPSPAPLYYDHDH